MGYQNRLGKPHLRYIWIFLYLLAVTSILYLVLSNWAYDDPFITYRYVKNLSSGMGFVYNPGQHVLSTTTPLFTLILAGLSFLWADLPHLANPLGAFCIALGAIFIYALARCWKAPWVGWVGLLLYPTFPLIPNTLGSETPLYLMLCLGAFAFYAQKRYLLTASFAALSVLTRPDGILIPFILGIDYLFQQPTDYLKQPRILLQTLPWRAIGIFVLLMSPWFIFAWIYFGNPLPVTLAAKQHQGAMPISQRFGPGFISVLQGFSSQWPYWVGMVLALAGITWCIIKARRWVLFLAWPILYFAAYAFLGVSRYFWYYAPLVPGFLVLVGLGLTAIHHLVEHFTGNYFSRYPWFSASLSGFLLISLALFQFGSLWQLRSNADPRFPVYRDIGLWLKENSPPEAQIGTIEVGIIGYFADRSMLDFAGLIYPQVAQQLSISTTYEDAAIWAAKNMPLDFIVLPRGVFPDFTHTIIDQYCREVASFSGRPYGNPIEPHIIYACNIPTDHSHEKTSEMASSYQVPILLLLRIPI